MTDLDQLLRETFTAHEHLADADRAVALARTPGRRSRPVAVTLAAIAVAASVVLGTAYVVSRDGSDQILDPATTGSPTMAQTTAVPSRTPTSPAEAQQLALALLESIPELPEADRVDSSPVPKLAKPTTSVMPTDHTRSATTWWTSPASLDDAVSFYLSHLPSGMELEGTDAGTSTDQDGVVIKFIQYVATDAPPFGGPLLFIDVMSTGDGVAVRADSFVNWTPARDPDSLVAGVTSVDVSLLRGDALVSTVAVEGSDLGRLVDDFNALEGPASFVHGCMLITVDAPHYRLVFHTGTGVVVADSTTSWMCKPGFTVSRDGQDLQQVLAVTNELSGLLHDILPSR
jgi:hypothetical protein